ncbi:MAG TPA: hypothetical protein VN519_10865 [Bryobacteraceae bacterium]|nr:hypothetical protein [Bryobacteraceae bacterium]
MSPEETSTVFGDVLSLTLSDPDRLITIRQSSRVPLLHLTIFVRNTTSGNCSRANSNMVVLDPNVHDIFRDARAVNDALRLVIELRKVAGRTRVSKN